MENANNFELFTDMTMDDVREYEKNMHEKTNIKVCNQHSSTVDEIESHATARVCPFLSILPILTWYTCTDQRRATSWSCWALSGIWERFCFSRNRISLREVQSCLSFALSTATDVRRVGLGSSPAPRLPGNRNLYKEKVKHQLKCRSSEWFSQKARNMGSGKFLWDW